MFKCAAAHILFRNNFSAIRVYDAEGNLRQEPEIPPQINGYEYEVLACIRAMEAGALECREMPHSETIKIMKQMDRLRRDWGVVYPFEEAVNFMQDFR